MKCAVLGDPIAHSLSPTLHRAGYAEIGLDWDYSAQQVPAGGLGEFLAGLDATWRGLSLTMPLKREAIELAIELTERARLAGAANTLLLTSRGPVGDNTDTPGAVAAIRERGVAKIDAAVILGGGATATSVGLGLIELGARHIEVAVRDEARATQTLEALRAHPSAPSVSVIALTAAPPAVDIVVSTIPAAAQTPELVAACAEIPAVFDVIYDPWPTPLATSAAERIVISGLDLLVHQAALQFEIFTDRPAPLSIMRAAGEQALAGRRPR